MDPLRIAVRAAFAFLFLLALVRISGKRSIAQGSAVDFVLALIFGDTVDDLFWAEVSGAQFVAAVGTLFAVRVSLGAMTWRARASSSSR
jgi:uncharacterized membrane protein YcaP (DUF421 family)